MRKNVKKQLALRVLSTAALVAMVSSIATAAFAAEYNVAEGSVEIVAKDGSQSITQWADKDKGTFVKDENGDNIDHRPDSKIVLVTKDETTGETKPTSNTVTITAENENDTANVTLQDVHIQPNSAWSSDPAPIEIKGNGKTNLELNGDNIVLSGNSKHAGIEKADVNGTGTLTIKDDVNDNGKPKTGTEEDTTGTLVAGGFSDGAGIGGGGTYDTACTSNITITGGDITARGGYHESAGIGGGSHGTGTNIRIEGNAHVTATGDGGAAIGGGVGCGNDVTIAGNAVVNAYSEYGAGIGDGCSNPLDRNSTTNITITDNAKVHAEAKNGAAAIGSSEDGSWNQKITIEKNANVTAVGSNTGVAIGTYLANGTTSIQITGGTVNAINSYTSNSRPAIGGMTSPDGKGSIDITVNSSTGDTVVNAYTFVGKNPPAIGFVKCGTYEYTLSDGADYNKDGSSKLGETHSAIINYYKDASVTKEKLKEKLNLPDTLDSLAEFDGDWDDHCEITGGTLTKVVHNRKYMEEHPEEIVDINKLKDEDLHDWKLVKRVEPTLDADGYADYICSIDQCGQTKHVVLPKLTPEPSEPDVPGDNTPDTPNKPDTPSTPDGTTPAPVTPDAPVQDSTAPADTLAADTTADAAVVPAAAQNVVQDAKPEAAATAAVSAAALPQTGANWLAVVGTALSGLFLLAAGFVLDRKNRRMN